MGFWKKIFSQNEPIQKKEKEHKADSTQQSKDEQNETTVQVGAAVTGVGTAQQVQSAVYQKFSVPSGYTGNRKLYDDGYAKIAAKQKIFSEGCEVRDPYTGQTLVLTKKEAKLLYGEEWTKHLAESDHIKALEDVFNETKDNPWLTNADRREVVNSPDNIVVTSRQFNNAKRSRSNKEFVDNLDYRKKTGVKLTKGGGQRAVQDEENAAASINRQVKQKSIENVLSTGHEAGTQVGISAGITAASIATIQNIVQVIEGKKNADEAIEDIVKSGGEAAAVGYVTGGGLTVISHTLSRASSGFIRELAKSNIPGVVITSCMAFGDTLDRYASGKISTKVCLTELGASALQMQTVGYSMGVGQAIIPIPIVGAAIGAAVGAVMSGCAYNLLLGSLGDTAEIRHRQELIAQCQQAAEDAQKYRKQLQEHMDAYFADYGHCFDEALTSIRFAFSAGDANGIIQGANQITHKVGGVVKYESVDEFKEFLDDEDEDIF